MKCLMQYPNCSRISSVFDGQLHEIIPTSLFEMNYDSKDLFLLNYVDASLGDRSMVTLLERKNGRFVKIPLTDYNNESVREFFDTFYEQGMRCDFSELPSIISTQLPLPLDVYLKNPDNYGVAVAAGGGSQPPGGPPGGPYNFDYKESPRKEEEAVAAGLPPVPPEPPRFNSYEPEMVEYEEVEYNIYYNVHDDLFFVDQDCKILFGKTGKIEDIGTLSEDGKIFYPDDLKVMSFHVVENFVTHKDPRIRFYYDYLENQVKYASTGLEVDHSLDTTIRMYRNVVDGKFYWNKEGTVKPIGNVSTLESINTLDNSVRNTTFMYYPASRYPKNVRYIQNFEVINFVLLDSDYDSFDDIPNNRIR